MPHSTQVSGIFKQSEITVTVSDSLDSFLDSLLEVEKDESPIFLSLFTLLCEAKEGGDPIAIWLLLVLCLGDDSFTVSSDISFAILTCYLLGRE